MSQERPTHDASSEDELAQPRFPFSEGQGIPLGQLHAVQSIGHRSAANKQLENAIEPLHLIVYGRRGRRGARRRALEEFRGFPDTMATEVAERIAKLKKDKLRDLVHAFGMRVFTSKPHAEVSAEVTAFLMRPREESKPPPAKTAKSSARVANKRERQTSPAAPTSPNEATNPPARAKHAAGEESAERGKRILHKEIPIAGRSPQTPAPNDDALRVAVYKRVLVMSRPERAALGLKHLREEMETLFAVPTGSLRGRKEIIAETASECVKALMSAEAAAALHGAEHAAEPSPAPHRPFPTEAPAAMGADRSKAPSHASSLAAPTFPANPPTLMEVSVPSAPPPGAPVL